MTSIQKLNSVLIGLVGLLVIANLMLDSPEKNVLTSISAGDIQTIEIHSGDKLINFIKLNQQWVFGNDSSGAIDQNKIQTMLKLLNTESFRQFEKNADNLKAFELINSKNHIRFNKTLVTFGTIDPVEQHRYVLTQDNIHLITDYYYQFLLADKNFFTAESQ
ncbi:MAG: hypothetical protein P8Y20_00525 [Gammaproteobacteria bacterium]